MICTGRINGQYADTTHGCRRYYVCEGGSLQTVVGCPRGRLYDGNTCRPAALVDCPSADTTSLVLRLPATDQCTDLPNGFYSQTDDDTCRGYVFCHNQQTIAKLRCRPGEYFNLNKCAPSSTANPCFSFCNGKQNGYYGDFRKHCREYVNCIDGNIVEHKTCNEGMLYDGKACVSSVLYKCPSFSKSNNCKGMRNGYHPDYLTNCREYFYCHEEQTLLRSSCAGGKVWNGSHCVLPYEFMCDGPEIWPGCSGLEDGLYPDLSRKSRCQLYYYCQQGLRIRLSCPMDKVFDGTSCVAKKEFTCPDTDDDCQQSHDGYYVDHRSGCRSYYYCSNGNKVSYLCPDDLIFNGKDCVDAGQYTCPSESKDCESKVNGYHGDRSSGCHSYMYCLKGKKIATFTCPLNQVFDDKQCVPFMLNNCMSESMNSSCMARPDGYYTEPHSHCMKYFQCVNNKRTKSFTCPTGKIFNGAKCVGYSCPEQSENLIINCDETSMGFFQDFSSDCKNYFFCINGVKTSLSCGQGLLFNGELCVSEDSYTCPSTRKHNITHTALR